MSIQSVNGQPFDPNATYGVVTNDFLAAGGDTYYALATSGTVVDTGTPMDVAVMDYIVSQLNGKITAEKYGAADGRISIVSAPVVEPEPEPAPEPEPTPEPAPEPDPTPAPTEGASYTVKAGDNLSHIAKALLGSAQQWRAIYEANKDTIKDPNLIYIGQVLVIPAA